MSVLSQQLHTHARLNIWLQRTWALAGGVSVRTKILGIVLAMTTILGIGITLQVRLVTTRTFIGELENRGNSVVRDLAGRSVDPLLLNDIFGLHKLLVETVENHPDVRYAFIEDGTGQVLAHTFDQGFPVGLLDLNRPASDDGSQHLLYLSNEGRIHDFAAPLLSGQVGVVRVGLSETRLQRVIDAITGQMLLTMLLVALVGIVAASLLTWLLTRPILDLVETTRKVGQGDMETLAPRWANDEIGGLSL
ncbi:MAG: HAMP domain-containing protein [Chloroflexi bacterium]|nr:HAMP domain-containing protein [Chloroflexota bacterium]